MKLFSKLLGLLLILLIVGIVVLPWGLSSKWGRETILTALNNRISGQIQVEEMNLSWFGPQIVQGFSIKDETGTEILGIAKFATKTPLLKLIPESRTLYNSQFKGLQLHLLKYPNGETNLSYALSRQSPSPFNRGAPVSIDIEDTNGNYIYEKQGEPMKLVLHGTTREGNTEGTFDIQIHLIGNLRQLTTAAVADDNMKISASLVNFPVVLLDEWFSQPLLSQAIGETINLDLIDAASATGHKFTLTANSPRLNGTLDGIITDQRFTLSKPGQVKLMITPELMSQLDSSVILKRPAKLALNLDEIDIPFDTLDTLAVIVRLNEKESDPVFTEMLGKDMLFSLLAQQNEDLKLVLENQKVSIDALWQSKQNRFEGIVTVGPDASLDFIATRVGQPNMDIQLTGTGIEGRVTPQKADFTFKKFQIEKFCAALCPDPSFSRKIDAVIGPTISGQTSINFVQGPVKVELAGSQGTLRFEGVVDQMKLGLTSPLVAQVKVTPALGTEVLDEIFPLLNGIQSADSPVTLTIIPDSFQFPLDTFDLNSARIKHAQLSLGKVQFERSKQMRTLLQLLNVQAKEKIEAWFTPLYFSMKEGVIKIQRIDMLVSGEYPYASWGKVDLRKDKVDLEVGVSAQALAKGFNLSGLPHDYMLTLNLKGTTNNVSINQVKAAAKISALVAKSQGTVEGDVVSTVIEMATTGLKGEKIPAPTTDPLPWQSEKPTKPRKKAKAIKEASSLLRLFLGTN